MMRGLSLQNIYKWKEPGFVFENLCFYEPSSHRVKLVEQRSLFRKDRWNSKDCLKMEDLWVELLYNHNSQREPILPLETRRRWGDVVLYSNPQAEQPARILLGLKVIKINYRFWLSSYNNTMSCLLRNIPNRANHSTSSKSQRKIFNQLFWFFHFSKSSSSWSVVVSVLTMSPAFTSSWITDRCLTKFNADKSLLTSQSKRLHISCRVLSLSALPIMQQSSRKNMLK